MAGFGKKIAASDASRRRTKVAAAKKKIGSE